MQHTKSIEKIAKQSSPEQLKLMALQYRLGKEEKKTKKILKVWERGASHAVGQILLWSTITFSLGYFLGVEIIDTIAQKIDILKLLATLDSSTKRILVSTYLTSVTIGCLNVYDVGRLVMWWDKLRGHRRGKRKL